MTDAGDHIRAVRPEDRDDPHPILAVWEITLACDQACRHCGSRAGTPRAQELDTAEALDLVAQLAAQRVREVTLLGGEAYLRSDWVEIVRAITSAGMRCTLVSGGRHLDPARIEAAARAGIHSISISVDGLGPAHDELRAVSGSWRAAMDALEALERAGVRATVNTQINRANLDDLEDLGAQLAQRRVRGWQLQLTTPMGRAADGERLVLQPWQLEALMPRLQLLAGVMAERGCLLYAANNLGYFGPCEGDLRVGGHWHGCAGGRFSIGIQSDGHLKACASLPTEAYRAGSIRERPLAEMLEDDPRLLAVADRDVADLEGFCRECYYAELCRGGCVWTAHTFLGRPGDNPFCHHRVIELKARGLRERLVREAAAPGQAFDHGRWAVVREPWRDGD